MSIASDLIRGNTETIILAQLMKRDGYGYMVNKAILNMTGGRFELKEATLYTAFRRLEDSGLISGYQAVLSPKELGYGVTAFVSLMMASHTKEMARNFEQRLLDIPEIVACHNISGRYDFLLEVVAKDLESFGEFAREVLHTLPAVKEIYSSFTFKSVKPQRVIPMLP